MANVKIRRKTGSSTYDVVYPAADWSNIDNKPATFTPTSHTHGDITNGGAITSTVVTPASGDNIIVSDSSASDVLKRGITIGTSTSTFLRNDGTWATPAGVDNYVNITGDTMSGQLSSTVATGTAPFVIASTTRVSNLNVATAGTADTLTTARTINVGTAASGTATSFNGSSNITIPINSVSESYLSWGGQNTVGYVTPVGMSLSNEHSANRLAFINGNSLYFEYSADAGATWTDYGYSASTKSQFCTTSVGVPIGRTSGNYTTSSRTRITLTAQDGTNTYVYTNPRKMLLEISSSGGMQVLVETRTGANYQSGGAWSTFGTYSLAGWSGWNDIPLVLGTLGGGTTQTGNNWQLRLTFIMTSVNATYPTTAQVNKLRIFGENTWFMPSTLAGTNDLYSYDMSQNALFPAIVQGTRFTSTVANGTAPLTVTSTTAVTNLNADLLDGKHLMGGNTWDRIPIVGSDGVLEIGKYIDFHDTSGDANDYATRLTSSGNSLTATGSFSATQLFATNNAGIGTTSPVLNSSGRFIHIHSPDTNASAIHFTNNTTGSGAANGLIIGRWNDAIGKNFIYTYNNEPISFGTNNLERMFITGAGNVGIGRTDPQDLLNIHNSSANANIGFKITRGSQTHGLRLGVNDTHAFLWTSESQDLAFANNDTQRMTIKNSTGNVGINTTSPSEKLEVSGVAKATSFTSTVATGTAPISVTSTTVATNLNADLLDGQHASAFAAASHTHAISDVTNLQTSLDAKAALASPALTGTPTAPTAIAGTNTTQIATTAFVSTAVANLINSAPGALDTLDELAAALGDDANFASTVTNSLALKAPLASPALTGTPTAPTAAGGTNTTQIATTQFVTSAVTGNINLGSNSITATRLKITADGTQPNWEIFESSNKLSVQAIDGSTNPIYDIWHSGNDGASSGLDADLLDGQQGTYYQAASTALTTSTSFGGDVSGTYNAIVVADDSHDHIISNVDGLQTALDSKAADADVVKLTGTQSVGGVKTFTSIPVFDAGITIANSSSTISDSITFNTAQAYTGPYLRGSAQVLQRGYYTAQYQIWDAESVPNPTSGTGTANQIAYYTGAQTLGSLSTATYPSLTELSYVKGVTSAIQTQLNREITKYRSTQQSSTSGNTNTTAVTSITLLANKYYHLDVTGMYSKTSTSGSTAPVITIAVDNATGTPTINGRFEWLNGSAATAYTVSNTNGAITTSATARGFTAATATLSAITTTPWGLKALFYTGTSDKILTFYIAHSSSVSGSVAVDNISIHATEVLA